MTDGVDRGLGGQCRVWLADLLSPYHHLSQVRGPARQVARGGSVSQEGRNSWHDGRFPWPVSFSEVLRAASWRVPSSTDRMRRLRSFLRKPRLTGAWSRKSCPQWSASRERSKPRPARTSSGRAANHASTISSRRSFADFS